SCQPETPNTLRVSEKNPRYFADQSGKIVYLTGSHTWDNLVDFRRPEDADTLDYKAYLAFLKSYNHNFTRLWAWDLLTLDWKIKKNFTINNIPLHPWQRSGTGKARDGNSKFDLSKHNQEYFDRLRARVIAAGKSDI